MLTKKEKFHYLTLSERHDRVYGFCATAAEERLTHALSTIDPAVRFEIDDIIGELVLEHEYKGYEIGRGCRHRCRRKKRGKIADDK